MTPWRPRTSLCTSLTFFLLVGNNDATCRAWSKEPSFECGSTGGDTVLVVWLHFSSHSRWRLLWHFESLGALQLQTHFLPLPIHMSVLSLFPLAITTFYFIATCSLSLSLSPASVERVHFASNLAPGSLFLFYFYFT